MGYKKLIRLFIYLAFVLIALPANAQITSLQNAIDKLDGYKSFSYQSVIKQKEAFGDTLVQNQRYPKIKKLAISIDMNLYMAI